MVARFEHRVSARPLAARRVRRGLGFLVAGALLAVLPFTFLLRVAGVMIALSAAWVTCTGALRLARGGDWELVVDADGLRWRPAAGMGAPCAWPLAELARVERRRPTRSGGPPAVYAVHVGGAACELMRESGADFEALLATLRALDVEVVEVRQL